VLLGADRVLALNVRFSRWVTCSGRASAILDDTELIEAINDLSLGAYHLPAPETGGANSEIARLDFEGMLGAINDDFAIADEFYSGQPYHHLSTDLWSSKSKVPFAGLDTNYARPWGDRNEQLKDNVKGLRPWHKYETTKSILTWSFNNQENQNRSRPVTEQ
jgi:hypothetical protein